MARQPHARQDDLYGRILHRLSAALAEAGDGLPLSPDEAEVEINGLTGAELALIRAYLMRNEQWLAGWHAAAQEQASLGRGARWPGSRGGGLLRGKRSAAVLQTELRCVRCQSEVPLPGLPGEVVCDQCGSRLLEGRQRFVMLRRH
ncbi:hypothetical protein [Stutzerimonas kunmingensis]|uniref:hypothetical protein n=1 Tax=Stutzerimonas kunmingensis TaxID=1211807 RepID=UPI00241F6CCC|nr:hypothetical protein [Stutzerimonas kunmingensis]